MPRAVLLSMLVTALAGCGAVLSLGSTDPRIDTPGAQPEDLREVTASAQTTPVADGDDAADDPAIWVHPADPAASFVVGTNKRRGLEVYDLSGRRVHRADVGRVNNVDLRTLGPAHAPTVVLAASNRSTQSVDLYRLDPDTGRIPEAPMGTLRADFADDIYGLCLHQDRAGALHVFANDKSGAFYQWRIERLDERPLSAALVRRFAVATQPEGCVADDANGWLFVGEEGRGIWRFPTAPEADASAPVLVASTGVERGLGRLHADVEGLALYTPTPGDDGAGYLVASSQGNFTYVVFDRRPPHAYRGTFRIVPGGGIDGVEETDGLDVTALALPGHPAGLLVVQDGFNRAADGSASHQNFKYVSWSAVATALGLP